MIVEIDAFYLQFIVLSKYMSNVEEYQLKQSCDGILWFWKHFFGELVIGQSTLSNKFSLAMKNRQTDNKTDIQMRKQTYRW